MSLRTAFLKVALKASLLLTTLGMSVSAPAQNTSGAASHDHGPAASNARTNLHTNYDSQKIKPATYVVPNYADLSNKVLGNGTRNFDFHQRYTYVNISKKTTSGSINLRNIITPAKAKKVEQAPTYETIEQVGGLYFAHGYKKFTAADIVTPAQYENVNLDKIASALITEPSFALKMTGHADTSGDHAKNYTLSQNRLKTGVKLLLAALEKQGLTKAEAAEMYQTRIAPYTTITAQGEDDTPVKTSDGVKEQGNRLVAFQLISQVKSPQTLATHMIKPADFDNHEHTVVMRVAAETTQKSLSFYPFSHQSAASGQIAIADENTNFIIKVDRQRQSPFVIKHFTPDNKIADNTNFLIESDQPGAVSNNYNFDSGQIDISVNGKILVSIQNMSAKIDPAKIRVGQITSQGQVTITPLTNLEDVAPISESRLSAEDDNVLTRTADRVTHLSIDAKHIYMTYKNDQTAYTQALDNYGFTEKLHDAFARLRQTGIDTAPYEHFVKNSFTNPTISHYTPDQIIFPFQTYEGLNQSQPSTLGSDATAVKTDAYTQLMKTVQKSAETKKIYIAKSTRRVVEP